MIDEKPKIDNEAKEKSKKKKDALEIHLKDLETIIGGVRFGGDEISGEADALASAKKIKAIAEKVIGSSEPIVKAAMLRQWCSHVHEMGEPPDIRRAVSKISNFKVVQQTPVKVTEEKVSAAAAKGLALEKYSEGKVYDVSLGNASSEQRNEILCRMREILGDDYENVVSERLVVGKEFFDNYQENVRKTLSGGEELLDKMITLLAIISPTIQFSDFVTDLPDDSAYEFTAECYRIDAQKEEAHRVALAEAKEAEKERKRIEKEKAKAEKIKTKAKEKEERLLAKKSTNGSKKAV